MRSYFRLKNESNLKNGSFKKPESTSTFLGTSKLLLPSYCELQCGTFHMRQLLKLDSKFEWSNECQRALHDMKNVLINAPILAFFRNDRKVRMYTDAGKTGLKNICLQFDDQNEPQVCSYISLATSNAQQKMAFLSAQTLCHWHGF